MRFTTKGIGWLIFGLIVCMSSTESGSFISKVSTIVLGLVFVGVYFIKQVFTPRGIGWFIGGGILIAFAVEEIVTGSVSNVVIALIIAALCLGWFYIRNRDDVEKAVIGIDEEEESLLYQPEDYQAAGERSSGPDPAGKADEADEADEVEYEFTMRDEEGE